MRLDARVRFTRDEGYVPPQGQAALLRPSSYLADEGGFWKVDADGDDGMPSVVQWRLALPNGLSAGGQQLIPSGSQLYFNAICSLDQRGPGGTPRVRLGDGRCTIKVRHRGRPHTFHSSQPPNPQRRTSPRP